MSKHEEGPIQFDAEGKRVEFDKDGKPKTEPAGPNGQPIGAQPDIVQDEPKNPELIDEPKPEANPAKGNQKPR